MSDQDGFDAKLAARFEEEHRQAPADAFVAATMRQVRGGRRRREILRTSLRVGGLAAIVGASPWLIPGVERLNAAVGSSLAWVKGPPGMWILGALATVAVVAMRVRSR